MLSPVYEPYDLRVDRAEGVRIFTDRGDFLDAYAGIGVLPLGHGHGDVLRAIHEKADRYTHLSNYFLDPDALWMADHLVARSGGKGSVYFSNSGAEAVEAALKAARKRSGGLLVSFEGDFHGRTFGSLSVTWNPSIRKPFEPLLPGCSILPRDGEVLKAFARSHEIAAVVVECIQGNTGVFPMDQELADALSFVQREHGVLVVTDEIQSGLGRSGTFFSYERFGLHPDVVVLGKGLGGGLPLGAALFCGWEPFGPGDHGSTFAPNPVSLAAGRVVLEHLTETFLAEVDRKGERMRYMLSSLPWVHEIRGAGLMIGVSTPDPASVKRKAFERHVLLNATRGGIRFLPALTISDAEIDEMVERLNFS